MYEIMFIIAKKKDMSETVLYERWHLVKTGHVGVPERNLPDGVGGGAGSQGQAGAPLCEGPWAGVWPLC